MVYNLQFFSLQNAVCFIILTYLVPVLFTFYIRGELKLKKNNSGAKSLIHDVTLWNFQLVDNDLHLTSQSIALVYLYLWPTRCSFFPDSTNFAHFISMFVNASCECSTKRQIWSNLMQLCESFFCWMNDRVKDCKLSFTPFFSLFYE